MMYVNIFYHTKIIRLAGMEIMTIMWMTKTGGKAQQEMPKHHTSLFLIAQHIIYQAFTHCHLKAHKHCHAFIIDALGTLRLGPRDDKGQSSGRQGSVLGTTKAIPRERLAKYMHRRKTPQIRKGNWCLYFFIEAKAISFKNLLTLFAMSANSLKSTTQSTTRRRRTSQLPTNISGLPHLEDKHRRRNAKYPLFIGTSNSRRKSAQEGAQKKSLRVPKKTNKKEVGNCGEFYIFVADFYIN
jgi:hypothetical protein